MTRKSGPHHGDRSGSESNEKKLPRWFVGQTPVASAFSLWRDGTEAC